VNRREKKMNRWHIYEMLKRNEIPTTETIEEIENMSAAEVKEGLLEWFTLLSRDKNYQTRNSRPKTIDDNPFSNPEVYKKYWEEFENARVRY
jgi:hypothetical protein